MSDSKSDPLREFVAEAREHLASVEPDLLLLERLGERGSTEVVGRVFRAIHSTKGGASFLAFESLKRFSHAMEGVLALIRDGKLRISAPVTSALLRGVDVLRAMVDDIDHSDQVPFAVELAALEVLLAEAKAGPLPSASSLDSAGVKAPSGDAHDAASEVLRVEGPVELQGLAGFAASLGDVARCLAQGMRLYRLEPAITDGPDAADVTGRMQAVGRTLGRLPRQGERGEALLCATVLESDLLAAELGLSTSQVHPISTEPVRAKLREMGFGVATGSSGLPPAARSPVAEPPREPSEVSLQAHETLRVRLQLLDRLMNTAGELVLGRNQLLRSLERLEDNVPGLAAILQHIDRVTTDLQEGIMQTRMQPVRLLFARFPRAARDQSLALGKQVQVSMVGEAVEVDKSIIEALTDPVTHLVRNSISHGIESPDERRAAGKSPVGRITLRAFHENGQIALEVSDDGQGMNCAKILERAAEKGLVDRRSAQTLRHQDIIDLAFAAGLSTSDEVSGLAGRGVGLDVVRTNVERLGGQIEVETEEGVGTAVLLRLPLTLAIIPSLIVGAGAARFAVPQASIVELVLVPAPQISERITSIEGASVLHLRGRLLPLVQLCEVLGMSSPTLDVRPPDSPAWSAGSDCHILVLRAGTNRFGLIVDELFESEEIVVKPLPAYVRDLDCFAGTTILGDGSVTMILEPGGLATRGRLEFAKVGKEEGHKRENEAGVREGTRKQRSIVVFDGAPTERFAVPQESVLRVERITPDALRQLGGCEYVQYHGTGMPVLRLDSVLPVSRVPVDATEAFLVVPRSPSGAERRRVAALLVWRIVDALQVSAELDPPVLTAPGVIGSTIVDGQVTTLFDPVLVMAERLSRGAA